MELKNSKIFNSQTMQAVSAFCESQEIKDIDNFIYLCFKQGFDIKKYGLLGKTLNEGEKHLKTGGIEEIRVEVPVEDIKEVEKVVPNIFYFWDETTENELLRNSEQLNELLSKIEHLNGEISIKTTEIDNIRQEFSTKTEEMENIFQNEMSKKDVELDELRQKLDDPVTNNKLNMLQETLQNLRNELQQKNEQIKELEKINRDLLNGNQNQAYLLRGSNLNRRI
jgi:predicted RNase H-like nuclease (RuvC/YqgF family)